MDKSIVIAFGRFNPPTTGHRLLLNFAKAEAAKKHADLLVFPSQSYEPGTARSQKDSKNPLPFDVKVLWLNRLFPDVEFSDDARIKTPIDALRACSMAGYDKVWVIVGSDRVADFMVLSKYVKSKGPRGTDIVLKEYGVIPVPTTRDPDAAGTSGMSASKMRAAALANDFETFRKGVPQAALARELFNTVRAHMNANESVQSQRAFLLYGPQVLVEAVLDRTSMLTLTPRDILLNSPRYVKLLSSKLPFAVDVRNESYVTIQRLHGLLESAEIVPTIYVYDKRSRIMSEDNLHRMTTSGLLKRGLARDVVEVVTPGHMIQSMIEIMEAEQSKAAGGLKTPSEVDRLQANQKQQQIMLKSRQAQELLQAKQRELAKRTRDDMNRIKTGDKSSAPNR